MESILLTQNPTALAALAAQAATCQHCALGAGRTQSVFARGNPQARLMLIGEGPGQHEDETGLPFVGKAGQLLDQILAAGAIDREQEIYICNIVKCRPPQNRAPLPEEMAACWPYLQGQIDAIRPQLILLAGATALKGVLNRVGISRLRGHWLPTPFHGAMAMPIFHPSYLLRYASREKGSPKWLTWQDIQAVRRALDALPALPPPSALMV